MSEIIECPFSVEGDGPPLILIHGIGAARDGWRFLTPILREHFKVVTYDLRGHGEAPMPSSEFGLDELVDDLECIRERCGFDRAHFAGHSLGGMIGPAYARKFPQRVVSLGILSTAAGRTEEDSARVWSVVHAMERESIPSVLPTLVERWFTDQFTASSPDIVAARLKQVIDTDPEIFLNVFRIYASTEMLPWLHDIRCPSLVLTGEYDGGCNPRLNRLIANKLHHSELVVLPKFRHSILLEAGEEVANYLVKFHLPFKFSRIIC